MKKLLPILWSSTLLIMLQGCSGQSFLGSSFFSPTEKIAPLKALHQPTRKITTLWQVKIGENSSHNPLHPYTNSTAIIVAGRHDLSAWNKTTGKLLWKKSFKERISGGLNGDDGIILLGTDKGNALALNAETGRTLWVKHLKSEILSVSSIKKGKTVFRSINGKLYGINIQTGDIAWQQQQLTPVLSLHGASTPILVDNYAITGFDNGKLIAYDLQSGRLIWEAVLTLAHSNNKLDHMVDIDGKIKYIDNALFSTSFQGRISSINAKTGKINWAKKFSSHTGTDADKTGVYTTDDAGNVWKLERQTGEPLWKMDDLIGRTPTSPTVVNKNLLVISDKEGHLHFINTTKGGFAARIKVGSAGQPIYSHVDNNIVYSVDPSGRLTALSIQ